MSGRNGWTGYAWAVGTTAACTLVGMTMSERFELVNIAMVYLLGMVFVALWSSRGPALAATVLSIAAFDLFFVPPRGTFTVGDAQYLLTFGIMLAIGLIIAALKERARRQANAQARLEMEAQTERMRSALLASISHDLRTPLAVMSGASSTLAERGERMSTEERRALATSVFEQSRELSERMAKVLQMTRLQTGAIELERDWESLGEIAGAVLRRLSERLAGHRVIIDLPDELPLVRVDAVLIDQVLSNLLQNAVRHTPRGTVVQLRAAQADGELVVSVQDFGPGVPDTQIGRLFAKFHHGASEAGTGGVGLGLPICRAIVRLHGGRVWVDRVPGGGLAFRFTLPLEPAPRVPAELATE